MCDVFNLRNDILILCWLKLAISSIKLMTFVLDRLIKKIIRVCFTRLTTWFTHLFLLQIQMQRRSIDNWLYFAFYLSYLSLINWLRLFTFWLYGVFILTFFRRIQLLWEVILLHLADATSLPKIHQQLAINNHFPTRFRFTHIPFSSSFLSRCWMHLLDFYRFAFFVLYFSGMLLRGRLLKRFNNNNFVAGCLYLPIK